MLHASETWPLTKPNLQRLQWNDRAMIRQICNVRRQDIVTTRSNDLLVRLGIEDLDLILKEKDLDGMDMWNAPVVQSRQPLTYRLMESVGLGGPKWHGSSWQRGIAESGSSRLSTLMIDVPGDLVWDLPCVQQASYLEGGPLMWMLPLYLHVNQKSDYDMMTISGKNQLSMTSIKYDHLQVMETITGKFPQYPLRNIGGVAVTKTSVDKWLKLTKGHNSGKKQSSMTLYNMILFRSWQQ